MKIDERSLYEELEKKFSNLPAPEPTSSWEYAELWVVARTLRLQVRRFLEIAKQDSDGGDL